MNRYRSSPLITVALLLSIVGLAQAGAVALEDRAAPGAALVLPTAFTYQGQLKNGGQPADGSYAMTFRLYDAATGGIQVGSDVSQTITVEAGLFTAILDFGASAFGGGARWLEIEAEGTTLTPRQQLTPTPYAIFASSVPWGGIVDLPAELADGDADTTYTAGAGLVLNGNVFSAQGSPYANVLVVATSGGNFTSIQASFDSITDAGPENPYLIYVAPGVYTETVTLKPYVTLEGAGQERTIIRGIGGATPAESATLIGANAATVRHLAVENTAPGTAYAIAIYTANVSPTISAVSATARGGTRSYGIYVAGGAPSISEVNATGVGTEYGYGIGTTGSPALTLVEVIASGTGGIHQNQGISFQGTSIIMRTVQATATGGSDTRGIILSGVPAATLEDVTASGSGGGYNNEGILLLNSSATMVDVAASGSGGSNASHGVSALNSNATIRDSVLTGGSNSVSKAGTSSVKVANSQLVGPPGAGLICFGTYNNSFTAVTCP